jgi:hypothetical protein
MRQTGADFIGHSGSVDLRGDVSRDGTLHLEPVVQIRLIFPGKQVGLVAGLDKLHGDGHLLFAVMESPFYNIVHA